MRTSTPTTVSGVATLVLALVTACGDPAGSSVAPDGASPSAPSAVDAPFAQAASRISPDALGEQPYVEFGRTAELMALSTTDQRWVSVTTAGNSRMLNNKLLAQAIGVDAAGADYSIEVGQLPRRIGVVAGGQDADAIIAAATATGYVGKDILTQELNPAVPVTVAVHQIKPVEDDVILATTEADLGWVGGGSLFADPEVGPVAVCLGDVLAATVAEIDGEVVGAGVTADGSEIRSVLCIPGGEATVEAVEADLAQAEYADAVEVTEATVEDGVARVTVQHGDLPAALLIGALQQRQLPGT